MLRRIRADLHVHTCLSPCGDLSMSPRKIAEEVSRRGIGILAVCDHNSAQNVPAVMRAADARRVTVLPGMEVCTREEIHVLAIFGETAPAFALEALVQRGLAGKNDPDVFGLQVVADDEDTVVGFEERMLIGASDLSVGRLVEEIHRLGGAAIAAHIDRESYSVISQLGFIPPGLRFDALELSRHGVREEFAPYAHCTFIRNSDAHVLRDIGTNTSEYLLAGPTFAELLRALGHLEGRTVCDA